MRGRPVVAPAPAPRASSRRARWVCAVCGRRDTAPGRDDALRAFRVHYLTRHVPPDHPEVAVAIARTTTGTDERDHAA